MEEAGKTTRRSLGPSVAPAFQVKTVHILHEKRECLSQNYLALERREVIRLCPKRLSIHPRLVLFKAHGAGGGPRAAAGSKGGVENRASKCHVA